MFTMYMLEFCVNLTQIHVCIQSDAGILLDLLSEESCYFGLS